MCPRGTLVFFQASVPITRDLEQVYHQDGTRHESSHFPRVLQSRNAKLHADPDEIHGDIYKHGGQRLLQILFVLVVLMWEMESFPKGFKDAIIVTIFKKDDKAICGNHRGISLLSAAGKIVPNISLQQRPSISQSEGLSQVYERKAEV